MRPGAARTMAMSSPHVAAMPPPGPPTRLDDALSRAVHRQGDSHVPASACPARSGAPPCWHWFSGRACTAAPRQPAVFPPARLDPKTLDAFGEGGAIWKLNDPVNWKEGANVNPSTFDYPAQGAYRQDLVQAGIPVANSPRAGQTASRPSVEAMD
jgi:hypothetical protein